MTQKKPPQKPDKKIVSVACRASSKCEGRKQKIVWKKMLPTGGMSVRYQCLTCNHTWFISL